MSEYKPNSHKYHAEKKENEQPAEKRATKIVSGPVKTKKKSEIANIAKTFIAEDVSNVGSYIFKDVLVPTIQKTIVNIVTDVVNMVFLGKSGRAANGQSNTPKVSYRSYYDDRKPAEIPRATNRFDYEDLVIPTRGEAEAVRVEMGNIIRRWGYVRVADMFDLAGVVPPVASYKYGWTDVSNAEVRRAGDGYVIKLPSALPID